MSRADAVTAGKPSVWRAFTQPAAWTMFFFGFSSGLPFLLVAGTFAYWLKDNGIELKNITLIAGAQTMTATSHFYRLEIAYSELEQYNRALTPELDVRDGYYFVSDRPGLGHELREDYLAQAIPF